VDGCDTKAVEVLRMAAVRTRSRVVMDIMVRGLGWGGRLR
jgi:hypothetical protein